MKRMYDWAPHRVGVRMDLLGMLRFYATTFCRVMSALGQFRMVGRTGDPIMDDIVKETAEALTGLDRECEKVGLNLTAKSLQRLRDFLTDESRNTLERDKMFSITGEIESRCLDELSLQFFFAVDPKHVEYCEKPQLFGEDVFKVFPAANDDIFEAGMCLAFGRNTACVMHLNRVLEVGLRSLAADLHLPNRPDWGRHLSDIEKELHDRYKAAGARTGEEQFYAEVASLLGHIKVAQRNPSSHVDKTYTSEKAEDIIVATRSFMRHLATRLRGDSV